MDAKDTVMSDTFKRLFRYIPDRPPKDIFRWDIDGALQAQAEISFPVGYNQAEKKFKLKFNPDYLDFQKGVEAGRVTGRLAGIREVLMFKDDRMMEYHDWYCEEAKVIIVVIPQAKLKEWLG